jgi:hypothetical protein
MSFFCSFFRISLFCVFALSVTIRVFLPCELHQNPSSGLREQKNLSYSRHPITSKIFLLFLLFFVLFGSSFVLLHQPDSRFLRAQTSISTSNISSSQLSPSSLFTAVVYRGLVDFLEGLFFFGEILTRQTFSQAVVLGHLQQSTELFSNLSIGEERQKASCV